MGEPIRFLFGGFVLGDRSSIPPAVEDDFQAAGLTHLMVVSGANVAFVLTLASPLTTRLRLFPGWAVTVGIIGAFALLTRFDNWDDFHAYRRHPYHVDVVNAHLGQVLATRAVVDWSAD